MGDVGLTRPRRVASWLVWMRRDGTGSVRKWCGASRQDQHDM